jgi:hypothetical protein
MRRSPGRISTVQVVAIALLLIRQLLAFLRVPKLRIALVKYDVSFSVLI